MTIDERADGTVEVAMSSAVGGAGASVVVAKDALLAGGGGGVDDALLGAMCDDAFAQFDRDHNGTLEAAEFAAWAQKHPGVQELFAAFA